MEMASAQIASNRKATPRDALPQDLQELPDEQLLDLFLERKGSDAEAAFETLVRRHGPMVLGVCRHILDELHDAEDAFQATFLVLARKAGTIRDRRVLGRWLYEVAYRIAIRSKTHSARRRVHEREGAEMSAVAAGPEFDAAWIELRPVLHEEVNRLPEKYRTAVVLCYLEGRTNEEAAEMLQWPVGTVKGRLSRLTRRGLALSAAFLAMRLSQNMVIAEVVPSPLVGATVRTAMRGSSAGGTAAGAISNQIAALAEDALGFTAWFRTRAMYNLFLVALLLALFLIGLTRAMATGFVLGDRGARLVVPRVPSKAISAPAVPPIANDRPDARASCH
jgi:RNA polymerase sigma factor (sigma-70 family)